MTAATIQAARNAIRARFGRIPGIRRRKRPLPQQREPKAIEAAYYKQLASYLAIARTMVERHLLPELEAIVAEREDSLRQDSSGKRAREAMERAKKAMADTVNDKQLERLAQDMGKRTTDFQKKELNRQTRAGLGIELQGLEPNVTKRLNDFVETNVGLIKTISSRYFEQVETVVLTGVRAGKRHEDLAKDIEDRFQVSKSIAARIARDQTLKLYGEVNQARQEALGVTSYTWRTSLDDRVRQRHVEREGKTFKWSQPPEDGHPGFPIQCRCSAEPSFDDLLEGLEGPEETKPKEKPPEPKPEPEQTKPAEPEPPPPEPPQLELGGVVGTLAAEVEERFPEMARAFGKALRVDASPVAMVRVETLSKLPPRLIEAVRDRGVTVHIGKGSVNDLGSGPLPGSPVGGHTGWNAVGGVYAGPKREIRVGDVAGGSTAVAIHEMGHAIDFEMGPGGPGGWHSRTPEWRDAHTAFLTARGAEKQAFKTASLEYDRQLSAFHDNFEKVSYKLRPNKRKELWENGRPAKPAKQMEHSDYYAQPGDIGPYEVFAEAFAEFHLTGAAGVRRRFGEKVAAYVEREFGANSRWRR